MTVNYEIGKPREDRRMRITLLLCVGRTKKRIRTDLFAMQTDLNRKGRIKNDSPIYKKVYERIRKVESEYSSLETFLTGEDISASEAIERIRHSDIPTFFTYSDRWLSRAVMKGRKNYVTAIRNFRAFTKSDIPFSFFSHSMIDDYLYSLRATPRAQSLYVNAIKRIYEDAEKDYDIKPFSTFRIEIPRQQKSRHRALDVETIRKIFMWQGECSRAILARDCAILSFCLCGTNSADLFTASPIRGNILSYDREKTKDRRSDNAHIEIIIPEQIRGLVRRYKGITKAFSFYMRFSSKESLNRSINIGLKTIQKDLNLPELTFYSFRHSWATIARNELGIEKSTVHSALNHIERDTMIDDIYIKKDFRLINEANQKVVNYVFSSLRITV